MAIYKLNVTQRSTSEHELLVEVGDKREVEVDAILSEIESQEITSFGEFNTLLEKYGLKIKGFSYGKYYTLGPIKVPEMEEAQNPSDQTKGNEHTKTFNNIIAPGENIDNGQVYSEVTGETLRDL